MAIGVDSSKWKPRKLAGTPAARAVNILGSALLGIGILFGAFYQYSSATGKLREALTPLYSDPVEEVERKLMIGAGLPSRTGDTIRKLLEEEARPDLPYK